MPGDADAPVTLRVLCDTCDALERASNSDELRAEMQKFAQELGFGYFAYVLDINSPSLKARQFIINGFPPKWMQQYVSRNYFKVDPVMQRAAASTLPTLWSGELLFDEKAAEFWEEARSFGLHAGLTFAVHDPSGLKGVFSLARDYGLDLKHQDLAALIGRAQLFAALLHQAVSRIALPDILPEQNISLTPRETECLKWSADGKTAWEIGRILGVAERTIVFHMNNVIKKLDATNKTQAIVRAVVLKLI